MNKEEDEYRKGIGLAILTGAFKPREPLPAEPYTGSISDKLALASMPIELLEQLERFCDLNPVGAADLITFTINVLDHGRELGREEEEVDQEAYERLQARRAETTDATVTSLAGRIKR